MSDDRVMGFAFFCIRKRHYAMFLALVLFLNGFLDSMYNVLFIFLRSAGSMTPSHCSGSTCTQIATCDGMQEATWHLQRVIFMLGGTFFGLWGFLGAVNRDHRACYIFATFLGAIAFGVYFMIPVVDGVYLAICGRYPVNVINSAVLWPVRDVPFGEGVKKEIRGLHGYPELYVDMLARRRVLVVYAVVCMIAFAFWAYSARVIAYLAVYIEGGVLGLGANFSVNAWREEVILKQRVEQTLTESLGTAWRTVEDVAWDDLPKRGYGSVTQPQSFNARCIAGRQNV